MVRRADAVNHFVLGLYKLIVDFITEPGRKQRGAANVPKSVCGIYFPAEREDNIFLDIYVSSNGSDNVSFSICFRYNSRKESFPFASPLSMISPSLSKI
jgi:hypothetical protein